jgi:hypothetical protein
MTPSGPHRSSHRGRVYGDTLRLCHEETPEFVSRGREEITPAPVCAALSASAIYPVRHYTGARSVGGARGYAQTRLPDTALPPPVPFLHWVDVIRLRAVGWGPHPRTTNQPTPHPQHTHQAHTRGNAPLWILSRTLPR